MEADRDRRHVVPIGVPGPLAEYESALQAELVRTGYAPSSVTNAVEVMRRLSRWMGERGVSAAALSPAVVDKYLAFRRQSCHDAAAARSWVGTVLRFLQGQGVVTAPDREDRTAIGVMLAAFRGWLVTERGLAPDTVRCYGTQARKFLAQLPAPLEDSISRLDGAAVITFVLGQATATANVGSAKAQVTALRALLRFLHVQGLIQTPLVAAVPGLAGWRASELPRILASAQVEALLGTHDLSTPVGLRDHAVLVTLARLGLRGGEIAALKIADVEWRAGEIVIRGKGSRIERLPLPAEVGSALADYLTRGRPPCRCAAVFVGARAPHRPLTPSAVRAIMGRACHLAGLPRLGAHRLRHTLASDLLRAGSSLAEVGQILRHRSELSTATYAKIDHGTLGTLARPWPGGA